MYIIISLSFIFFCVIHYFNLVLKACQLRSCSLVPVCSSGVGKFWTDRLLLNTNTPVSIHVLVVGRRTCSSMHNMLSSLDILYAPIWKSVCRHIDGVQSGLSIMFIICKCPPLTKKDYLMLLEVKNSRSCGGETQPKKEADKDVHWKG